MKTSSAELHKRLGEIFEERDRSFPLRVPQNTIEMKSSLIEYAGFLLDQHSNNFKPDRELTEVAEATLNNPIFIAGAMKSGTTLLVNLLDNHPELIVLPGDTHALSRIKRIDFLPGWERKLVEDWVHIMVNPTGQYPYWLLGETDSNYLTLVNYILHVLANRFREGKSSMEAAIISYFCANPNKPSSPKFWVEKTPGNENHTEDVLRLWPRTKFIHVVRDGRSNLASLKKLYHFRGSPWQTRANVLYLAESHLRALENRERFGESIYLVVSYEQLVERTDSTMHRISEFLNIRFNESMLRPTVNGFPATANSMFKTKQTIGQVRRLDAASLGEVLSREDDDALIALFYPRIQEFGYLDGVGKAKRYSAIVRTWLRKIRSVHLTPHKS